MTVRTHTFKHGRYTYKPSPPQGMACYGDAAKPHNRAICIKRRPKYWPRWLWAYVLASVVEVRND